MLRPSAGWLRAGQRAEHVLGALRVAPCGLQVDAREHPPSDRQDLLAGKDAQQAGQRNGGRSGRLHADQRVDGAGQNAGNSDETYGFII